MAERRSYFDQAVAALERSMRATKVGEQAAALEEALRLNRLFAAQERAKLDRIACKVSSALDPMRV